MKLSTGSTPTPCFAPPGVRLAPFILIAIVLVPCLARAVIAQPAPPAEQEFASPRSVAWGIGKNYFRLLGGGAFSVLQGEPRVSLQISAEYLVANCLGVRLEGDIPVYWEHPVAVYDIYLDDLIHFLPHRRFDLYSGLGSGVRITQESEEGTMASPLLSMVGGLGIYPRFPYTMTLEGRAAWSVRGNGGDDLWLLMVSLNVGVVF